MLIFLSHDQGMSTGFCLRHCKGFTSPPSLIYPSPPLQVKLSAAQRSVVQCLLLTSCSQVVQVWRDTVRRQQWGKAEAPPPRLLQLSSSSDEARNRGGGGVADLCFSNPTSVSPQGHVSSATFKPEQDKAFPLYLGFWGSGPAAWQAEQQLRTSPARRSTGGGAPALGRTWEIISGI